VRGAVKREKLGLSLDLPAIIERDGSCRRLREKLKLLAMSFSSCVMQSLSFISADAAGALA
jgi:hypothetical protein